MPVIKNVRPGIVPISAEDCGRQKRGYRRAISAGEISDRHFAALREAKIPGRFADLDAELKTWKP